MKRFKVAILTCLAAVLLAAWYSVGGSLTLGKFRVGMSASFRSTAYMDFWTPWGGCVVINGQDSYYSPEREAYCWWKP